MNTNILKLLSFIALAACLVAAAGLSTFWRAPVLLPHTRPVLSWRPDFNPSPTASGKEGAAPSQDELLARPIFAPSRRSFVPPEPTALKPPLEPVAATPASEQPPAPAPEPVVAAAPQPAPLADPGRFQLKGIMESGNQISALIVTPQTPDGAWLVKDSDIMGWTLTRIEKNSVILKGDGREVTLLQYADKPTQDPPKAAADAWSAPPNPDSPTVN